MPEGRGEVKKRPLLEFDLWSLGVTGFRYTSKIAKVFPTEVPVERGGEAGSMVRCWKRIQERQW